MNALHATLTFLGGVGSVTGSKHLISVQDKKVLIDCGLFQGLKEERLLNWAPFPIDPRSIDAVVVTHAHLDHTGYLPLLVKQGFQGAIYCSPPTAELMKLILLDSAKIQTEDAEHANQHSYSKHSPALPLYTAQDVEKVFTLVQTLNSGQWFDLFPKLISIRLSSSGHILGSTFVEVKIMDKIIAFSGDLGREKPITLKPRVLLTEADSLVIESTYGDRCHLDESAADALARIINHTLSRKGQILIPAFAVGRTQDILYLIAKLKKSKHIPNVPVYVDSPMAERATHIFDHNPHWHALDDLDIQNLSSSYFHVSSTQDSIELCKNTTPSIIIAGSGMLSGGRILHHLKSRISDSRNSVVLVGFQAAGTLGRFLREGANEIKIHGQYLPVKSQIFEISSLSAHADQHEIIHWMQGFQKCPSKIFIVHGEANAAEGLRVRISDEFKANVSVAKRNETVNCFLPSEAPQMREL